MSYDELKAGLDLVTTIDAVWRMRLGWQAAVYKENSQLELGRGYSPVYTPT